MSAPKMSASCLEIGIIIIDTTYSKTSDGEFSTSGNYADYTFTSAEKLHEIASEYSWVERNGKTIKGSAYTARMAKNDFNTYAE